jgi:peroxiredoxin
MSWKRRLAWTLGVVLLLVAGAGAWMFGPALLPAKDIAAGIAKDAKVPVALPLLDAKGETTTLAAQMGQNGMVLYFVRSADWCPFCTTQLVLTEQIRARIEAKGLKLASVSYDKPAILDQFAKDEGIGYAMLSDTGSKLIDAIGLRDPQYEAGSFAYGVPRAATLVLAPDGTVKARFVAADYRSRISNDEVVAMVEGAGLERTAP